jgi:outer membrane protein OmpA-like peptidoglycan-associated protein
MKHVKIALLALLLIVSYGTTNAQDKENPWMLTFGANAIDINGGDSDITIGPKMSLGRYLGKGFSLELASAVNEINRPWGSGSDATFVGLDLNVKYDLNNAFGKTGWFDPFLFVGGGENWVGAEDGLGFNAGAGFNAWFSDHVGINVTGGYKKVNTPVDFEMMQYSVGLAWKFGNSDSDGDGIRDKEDECPFVVGIAALKGCPDTDSDNDGVEDCRDECPEVAGLAEFHGCPDTDGDGVPDNMDKCPEVAGLKMLHGCPDRDGDGTADKDDACPDVPGPKTNAGCPFKDTDGDGVIDLIDRCVEVKGPASNDGCPVIPGSEIMDELNEYGRTILFDTAKWTFKQESYATLEPMTKILKEYPDADFVIEGHTDSVGSDKSNQLLSERRANAVRDYFVSNGINADRLTTKAFGESKPVDTNDTAAGRANNRRTEVKLAE